METSVTRHPLAIDHLPPFITAPGQTDFLFNFVVIFLIAVLLGFGVLYMRLHALPEHLAHRGHKIQFELVAILSLIALFTHSRYFWIAALILAMVDLPDFLSPVRSMANSLRRMAGGASAAGEGEEPAADVAALKPVEVFAAPAKAAGSFSRADDPPGKPAHTSGPAKSGEVKSGGAN